VIIKNQFFEIVGVWTHINYTKIFKLKKPTLAYA